MTKRPEEIKLNWSTMHVSKQCEVRTLLITKIMKQKFGDKNITLK